MKALDLFCCGGGAGMGLHQAGFEVTGVDIASQPKYPFAFHQADAVDFPLDGFDFLWASPPCQAHTKAKKLRGNKHPCFIDVMRKRFIAAGKLYCIENVPGAPLVKPILLCGEMFGLKTYRHRLFEVNFPVEQPWHKPHPKQQVKMGRPAKDGDYIQVVGNFSSVAYAKKAMGIDWLGQQELREAIPPAFSRYIAEAALSESKGELK